MVDVEIQTMSSMCMLHAACLGRSWFILVACRFAKARLMAGEPGLVHDSPGSYKTKRGKPDGVK